MFSLTSRKISHDTVVVKEQYQLMAIVDETVPESSYQVILVYLSKGCDLFKVAHHISHLLFPEMTTIITGDFNFDKNETNILSRFFKDNLFSQKVLWPTHIQGRTLDHCYLSKNVQIMLTRYSPYYSDHSALCIDFQF